MIIRGWKCFFVVLGVLFCAGVQGAFLLSSEAVQLTDQVSHSVWQADVPLGKEVDQIGLHQLTPLKPLDPVLLYLPGTNMNGAPSIVDERHNLLMYLTNRGITTYAMNYRTAAIPADYDGDLKFMRDWNFDLFVQDAVLAFNFIKRRHPNQPVFVAGFSRGASYAYALTGQVPAAGLVVLDGSFKGFREAEFDRQSALRKLDAEGQYASILSKRRGWANRQALMAQVTNDVAGPAMDPKYETIGEQLKQTLYHAWGPGALTNPVDGMSDVRILAQLMLGYDRFFPLIQDVDGAEIKHLKNASTHLDDHFGKLNLPLIYFGATNLGADHVLNGVYSAGNAGASKVELHVLENYGHLDVIIGTHAVNDVFAVVHRWIQAAR
tara:strand:+ start:259 stop:1395 length:1137 start_codon:yes stop_codon:yes gene_type:complete